MKDLIEERNRKEKMQRSIIKRWNVNYIDEETLKKQLDEEEQKAREVYERLKAEKEADEELKRLEREQAYLEAAKLQDTYNETTGAYSGEYGHSEVDEVTKGQIDKILNEKEEEIQKIVHSKELEHE